jgi:hypothetical protein
MSMPLSPPFHQQGVTTNQGYNSKAIRTFKSNTSNLFARSWPGDLGRKLYCGMVDPPHSKRLKVTTKLMGNSSYFELHCLQPRMFEHKNIGPRQDVNHRCNIRRSDYSLVWLRCYRCVARYKCTVPSAVKVAFIQRSTSVLWYSLLPRLLSNCYSRLPTKCDCFSA